MRVKWVVDNLDPNPIFRRFLSEVDDVVKALEANKGGFGQIPHIRTWQIALQKSRPPKIYVDWICALYPDLNEDWLRTPLTSEFVRIGRNIQAARERWRSSVRYLAQQRHLLASIAKKFYRDVDFSARHKILDLDFPLLTAENWIRGEPLELSANTELPILAEAAPSKIFSSRRLSGLQGDYIAYRGALAYATRRVVRPDPQHNGEIFCAREVTSDSGGFVGFKYYLARYFDYINTCEILGAELASWVLSHSLEESLPELSIRGSPESAFKLTNRAAYPGINCLTVFLNYSEKGLPLGNYFLLHKRDETQLQAQNSIHVVPAGGHQSFAKGASLEDTAIWRTIVREFCEELFDVEELNKQPETWEDFMLLKGVQRIFKVFFPYTKPAARVYLHGFGLDPITLKPEVIVTIVVDWKLAQSRDLLKLKYNWELQLSGDRGATRHQWVKLSRVELLRQAKGRVQSIGDIFLNTLPAGAACMMQTWKHYERIGLPG
jgi:hypothetical protein